MSKVQLKNKTRSFRVTFSVDFPEAAEVTLVGSFNDWNPQRHPMQRKRRGAWEKTVVLPPGIYEYKFWIDGQWREDPRNAHTRPNPYGSVNSIVAVPLPDR